MLVHCGILQLTHGRGETSGTTFAETKGWNQSETNTTTYGLYSLQEEQMFLAQSLRALKKAEKPHYAIHQGIIDGLKPHFPVHMVQSLQSLVGRKFERRERFEQEIQRCVARSGMGNTDILPHIMEHAYIPGRGGEFFLCRSGLHVIRAKTIDSLIIRLASQLIHYTEERFYPRLFTIQQKERQRMQQIMENHPKSHSFHHSQRDGTVNQGSPNQAPQGQDSRSQDSKNRNGEQQTTKRQGERRMGGNDTSSFENDIGDEWDI